MKKKLCEIGEIIAGGTPSTKIKEYWNGDISWITPKDLSNYQKRFISKGERSITEEGLKNSSAIMLPKNSILFTSRAPIGYIAIAEKELCTNQGFKSFVCNEQKCYYQYMYYWFLKNVENIKAKANGSTFQEISGTIMKNIEIELPDMKTQINVGNVLERIDNKIELNNQINDNLYEILETLYKNKLSLEDDVTKIKTLDEYCNIFTGKKNANEFDEDGENKFFTCGEKTLKINSYIYDGATIIISGNGAYTGRTMFYKGKFDLYQRTYACTPKNNELLEYIYALYIIVKKELTDKIKGGTHGSAIPYIVMSDLAEFKIMYSDESIRKLSAQAKVILDKIIQNDFENNHLEQLRNTLLPKLMNGEIDIDKIKI